MSIRVNLLKPSEARRQGRVSVKFMIRAGIVTTAAVLLIIVSLSYSRYETGKRELEAARMIWKVREPMYNKVVKMAEDLTTAKKLGQELRGWQASCVDWNPLLMELRDIWPPTAQLRRLGIRGDLFIQKKTASEMPAVESLAGETGAPPKTPPLGLAMRWYSLTIEGQVSGDMSEDVVVQFVRKLGSDPIFQPIFESPPKLSNMQRAASRGDEQPNRTFMIQGVTQKKAMRESRADSKP
jgi:hypothetical protein